RACHLFGQVFLAEDRGDTLRIEALHREAAAILPRDSPRYVSAFLERAYFLCCLCRGGEVREELEGIARGTGSRPRADAQAMLFAHAVETGRVKEARRLEASIGESPPFARFFREAYEERRALLRLIGASREISPGPPEPAELPAVARPIALLLLGRTREALAEARRAAAAGSRAFLVDTEIPGFNLVRAELSCGHGEAARRLLEMRRSRGNAHPLDGLFLARVENLAGRTEEGARRLAEALAFVERAGAEGRLDFELRLARELRPADLVGLVRGAERIARGRGAAARPQAGGPPARPGTGSRRLVGRSPPMSRVREEIHRFAPLDAPVLVTGETGTGKELVARAIHEEGPRAREPFLAVNCGAIAESLLESELFGHERGAFTGAERAHAGLFEQAGRGTLLLDEIGEIPPRLQVALLRVLEAGEVRPVGGTRSRRVACRVVAATNADLPRRVQEGGFRRDLLYRLRRLEIAVPPLRERGEDVVELVERFLAEGREDEAGEIRLSPSLREALTRAPWRGNVRELRNAVERMRILSSDALAYDVGDLLRAAPDREESAEPPPASPDRAEAPTGGAPPAPPAGEEESFLRAGRTPLRRRERLRELFRRHRILTRAEAARLLGVGPDTVTADLKALQGEGLVEKVRPTESPRTHFFALKGAASGILPAPAGMEPAAPAGV
ncbi:MAG: sigma 54-interacting transcriptional regulator, partial [Planctomycetales bacterium]|nr:sigma 54-interacting transcriptional regulator [Planctomycetales bacterium]